MLKALKKGKKKAQPQLGKSTMCSYKLSFSTLRVTKIAQMNHVKGPVLQVIGANVHLSDGKY